jgi:hypothetical protein
MIPHDSDAALWLQAFSPAATVQKFSSSYLILFKLFPCSGAAVAAGVRATLRTPTMSNTDTQTPAANPSTGPRTEDGKAISSRNAAKHNLSSKRLSGTDLDELNGIRTKLDDEWEPSTETERMLLDQMALSQWRMDRALSLELAAFNDDQIDQPLLALALRYRTTAELQRLRKTMREDAVREEKDQEPAVHREMERLCFAPIAGAPSSFRRMCPPRLPRVLNPITIASKPTSNPKSESAKTETASTVALR